MKAQAPGWEIVGLMSVCDFVRGVTYNKVDARDIPGPNMVPVIRANNIQDRRFNLVELVYVPASLVSASQIINDGDVVIATSSGSVSVVGKAAQARENMKAGFGAFCGLLRPAYGIDTRFFGHYFRSDYYRTTVSAMARGVNINNLKRDHFEVLRFPLAPAAEQTRIADKLDTMLARVDACRDRLARVAPLLKRFRQSVLAAATSGRLTEDWRVANLHVHNAAEQQVALRESFRSGHLRVRGDAMRIEQELLYELPSPWSWIANYRLAADDSNAICAGPFGTIFKAKDFRDVGVPIIFLRHVGEGRYLTHKPGFMDEQVWASQHQPYSVYGGELLVTKLGDPPGSACLYPKDIGVAMVTPDVIKMNVDSEVAEPIYLMHYFNSPNSKRLIEAVCFGVTRLRIDISMFKTFPIPLPPRAEQTEVVRRVESLFAFADRLETRLAQARSAAERLTPALLAKAFRGELVPQDPDDEPAAELLKRLAALRAQGEGGRARRNNVSG